MLSADIGPPDSEMLRLSNPCARGGPAFSCYTIANCLCVYASRLVWPQRRRSAMGQQRRVLGSRRWWARAGPRLRWRWWRLAGQRLRIRAGLGRLRRPRWQRQTRQWRRGRILEAEQEIQILLACFSFLARKCFISRKQMILKTVCEHHPSNNCFPKHRCPNRSE